jgi:hypothetical protein
VTPGRFPYVIGGYAGVPEAANLRGRRGLEEGAIEDNSSGETRQPKVIAAIRPATASPGKTHQLSIELAPEKADRIAVPAGPPVWVQIGPFEATEIKREGNHVVVTIQIPKDAPPGILMDCHLEFSAANRPNIVFKANDMFRVVEEESP